MSQDSISGSKKVDAVFIRQVKDIRIQELENDDPHLFIALVAESSHPAEPAFTFQFLFGDSLDHVQQLLGDEAFEFAEGLPLKNGAYECLFVGVAFAENQLANFLKQGAERVPQFFLQLFPTLEVSQLRKLTVPELQQFAHLVVNVGPVRHGGQFFLSQQL